MGRVQCGSERHRRVTEVGTRLVDVAGVEELPEGTLLMVQVDGTDIVLVSQAGRIHALQGTCSHQYFELDKGFLTGDSITCALHLSRFDLETGEPLDPPADLPLVVFPVSIEGERVLLTLPEGPIEINE